MDELMINKEYHIAYLLGTEFETRMFDMYIGLGTSDRPPYLEDIFIETSQMQALIFLESVKNEPARMGLSSIEWKDLHREVWHNDDHAKMNVLMNVSKNELDNVAHDILLYLTKYRMSTLTRQNGALYSYQANLIHSPFKEVW